jgi:hypothetical protein
VFTTEEDETAGEKGSGNIKMVDVETILEAFLNIWDYCPPLSGVSIYGLKEFYCNN